MMMPSISSSVLGGVFVLSAMACFAGVDRGVSSTVFMPADAARYSIAADNLPPAGRASIADLAFLADPALAQPVFSGGDVAATPSGSEDMSRIYFDPHPLTNVELPVWNVFRVGAQFQHLSKFKKAPTHHGDRSKMPPITEKLPVGCDPMVSPVANRVLAQIPISCVSSNDRADRKLASDDATARRYHPV
jgi:hypothetical protein